MAARSDARRRRAAPRTPVRSAAPVRPPRPAWHVAAALAVVHLLLTFAVLSPAPHLGGDNAAYYGLARALVEGRGYVELWDPAMRPHGQYPPGFPALLAAALAIGVKPWVGFKVLVALISAGAVAVSYLWIRRVAGRGVALPAALVVAVAPGVLVQSARELSDVPFWLFTMLVLWMLARAFRERAAAADASTDAPSPASARAPTPATAPDPADAPVRADAPALAWVAAAGLAAACAWLTRSAALPLVLAVIAWMALGRRWKPLAVFLVAFVPLPAFWWLHQRVAAPGASYANAFWWRNPYDPSLGTIDAGGMVTRIGTNLWKYVSSRTPSILLNTPAAATAAAVVGAIVLSLAAIGWARRARRGPGVPEIFLALYVALLLVWPDEWADDRFLLPILPLLMLYAALAIRYLAAEARRPRAISITALVVLLVLQLPGFMIEVTVTNACRAGYPDDLGGCYPEMWAHLFSVFQHMNGALPPGSVVLSRKPTLTWALSGYRSRVYPYSTSADTFFAAARQAGAQYLIIDSTPESGRFLSPVVFGHRDEFCVVRGFAVADGVLVRISRDHPPLPPKAGPSELVFCRT